MLGRAGRPVEPSVPAQTACTHTHTGRGRRLWRRIFLGAAGGDRFEARGGGKGRRGGRRAAALLATVCAVARAALAQGGVVVEGGLSRRRVHHDLELVVLAAVGEGRPDEGYAESEDKVEDGANVLPAKDVDETAGEA